jgi:hypothetical protein
VVTDGDSSIDVCSQLLARRLGVREFHTDIFQQVTERFNTPLFSLPTLEALRREVRFVVALNRIGGLLHLSNHHLGRYGVFLRSPFIVTVHDALPGPDDERRRGRTAHPSAQPEGPGLP